MPALEWNAQVERETAHLYERVKDVVPSVEWPFFAPSVKAINDLKKERGAVILAHNYQTPEIYNCVADFVGDSLQLAVEATSTKAPIIVQAGVHFMAETSKILNPDKTVLIPDVRAGCSLAESITGEDVRLLRDQFPGVPIVAYVNTSADVKAEVDICCTSANAVQVVESLGADKVIFLPDQYLASYVASQTNVKIISWKGACEVHERFTGRRAGGISRRRPVGADHRASRMPARRARRGRLHRLDQGHDRLGAQEPAEARRDGHRMLDGRQREGRAARRRVRQAVQSLPAHEAHHAAEDSRQPGAHAGGGFDRSDDRREGAALGRTDDPSEELSAFLLPAHAGRTRWRDAARDERARIERTPMSILPKHSDTLIIGGGLAGLFCALKLGPQPVTVITAAPLGDGASSAWAQGGIAAAVPGRHRRGACARHRV